MVHMLPSPHRGLVWRTSLLTLALLASGYGVATAAVGIRRHAEIVWNLEVDVPQLCAASATGDACRTAMTSALGTLAGAPVAYWGLATHVLAGALLACVALGATAAVWPIVRWSLVALRAIVVVLAMALLIYLGIGRIILGHACEICATMHAANFASMVLIMLTASAYQRRLSSEEGSVGLAGLAAVTVLSWAAIAVTAVTAGRRLDAKPPSESQRAAQDIARAEREVLLRPCLGQCIEGMVYTPAQAPPGPTLTFGALQPNQPHRVMAVDLTCPHCREELRRVALAGLGEAAAGRGAAVQLVLRPRAKECNDTSSVTVLGPRMCHANAALLCAWKSRPEAALDYLLAELALVNEQAAMDRKAWLVSRVDARASQCFDNEVNGGFPGVRQLAATGQAWQDAAAKVHPECRTGLPGGPSPDQIFWCMASLPSVAVVRPPGPTVRPVLAADPGFVIGAGKVNEFRWQLADPCLGIATP